MSKAQLIFLQALTFLAVVGGADSVESTNRVECTDGTDFVGGESFGIQFLAQSSLGFGVGMVELNPTHEIREGVDVLWQIPENPKGVLYLAHSRNGSPFSYWPAHTNAPECIGTPEHVVATRQALERGFAVIASKSVTDEWQTWPPSESVDVQNCEKILGAWRGEHGLQDLPLSAWGTSIGGDYVSSLATVVKMHSLIVMISHGKREAFESAVAEDYPPTLFVPMIKDERTFAEVKENVQILLGRGIPSGIEEAPPLKVHPHFFAEHIDSLDHEQSAKLQALFLADGVIGEDHSVNKVLMQHSVEPYLEKAGLLDDSQRQEEEETFIGAQDEKPDRVTGGCRIPLYLTQGWGGQGGGRGVPPSARGEAPPTGGGPVGVRVPPSQRGEAPAAGGRATGGPVRGRGPPSERGEGPPAGGRGTGGPVGGRGPPSERGEGPPAGGRGGGGPVGGRGPPSERGEAPPRGGRGGGGLMLAGGGLMLAGGGPPPSHPLAHGISNQLRVAEGKHTLTSRHNAKVFSWLEGEGWPEVQAQ